MVDIGELPRVQGVGEVIRQAVAPVFLLSGVGVMLTLFINRLARAVDRSRELERHLAAVTEAERVQEVHKSLAILARRGRLLSSAIALATICALLISIAIVALFLGDSFNMRINYVVATLFIAAMLSLIGAILCFLREVFIATTSLRLGLHRHR